MFKRTALVAASLVAFNAHALVAGDLAFTSFNADEDGFAMVALTNIAANTIVFFGDNEWNGQAIGLGGAFNTGESYSKWTSGASVINAGTVIRFSDVDTITPSVTFGTFARETVSGNTNWGIGNNNETIYAYQGTSATAPTAFIAAVTNGSFTANGPLGGTGLVEGQTAIRLNANATSATPDFAQYTGTRAGQTSFAAYLPIVNNPSNWFVDTSATNLDFSGETPVLTPFAVVPEPASVALTLAGLAVVAGVARRRQVR